MIDPDSRFINDLVLSCECTSESNLFTIHQRDNLIVAVCIECFEEIMLMKLYDLPIKVDNVN